MSEWSNTAARCWDGFSYLNMSAVPASIVFRWIFVDDWCRETSDHWDGSILSANNRSVGDRDASFDEGARERERETVPCWLYCAIFAIAS